MRKRKKSGRAGFPEIDANKVIEAAMPKDSRYEKTYLRRNEIKTRQCVYISHEVHEIIAKLTRVLADANKNISIGGYIDTVLTEHLRQNKDAINELYRKRSGDLF